MLYPATVPEVEKTRLFRRVYCAQLVLYLRRCNLSAILVKRQHHGNPVPQGQILPREIKSFTALVGPGRAHARPDFFADLDFARGLTVVENMAWSVWHRNAFSATASSIGDWQGMSTRRGHTHRRQQRAQKEKSGWSVAGERSTLGERATPAAHQKGAILEMKVGQAGTASNLTEEARPSSGGRICRLS